MPCLAGATTLIGSKRGEDRQVEQGIEKRRRGTTIRTVPLIHSVMGVRATRGNRRDDSLAEGHCSVIRQFPYPPAIPPSTPHKPAGRCELPRVRGSAARATREC